MARLPFVRRVCGSVCSQAFFQRWWVTHPEKWDAVRTLVRTGQLTFVNGGYAMHDEAAPTFIEMADNMALGHRHILRQFGPEAAPRAAWSSECPLPPARCLCTDRRVRVA